MKKIDFGPKPGSNSNPRSADQWVMGVIGKGSGAEQAAEPTKRLTIDVPLSLHKRFKTQCAVHELVMADVIRELLEQRFPEQAAEPAGQSRPTDPVSASS
jgi:hypothetical protein